MKIEHSESDERSVTDLSLPGLYGGTDIRFEISRSTWMEGGVKIEVKLTGNLEVEFCLQRAAIRPLIDALYRAELWEPKAGEK